MYFRVAGFEPATPCSQNKCASGLRYTLKLAADNGNRTHMVCLEGRKFTINLYPQKNSRRITGFEPVFSESQSDTFTD